MKCVAQNLGGVGHKIRLGEDATEADVKRLSETGELADYRVLHFATHGLLSGDTELMARREGEPALVMTPPRMPIDLEDDGLLKASEVARLKLNADWVILSACNTAGSEMRQWTLSMEYSSRCTMTRRSAVPGRCVARWST